MVQVQETALSRSMKSDWRFEAEGKYNHKCGFSLKTLVAGGWTHGGRLQVAEKPAGQ